MQDLPLAKQRPGERIFATDEGLAWMDAMGLDSVESVAAFRGGVVTSAGTHGRVRRCEGPGGSTAYLKVYEEGPRSWLRRLTRRPTLARQEVLNMERVRTAGVMTPVVFAWGEDRRGRSFLLTSAAGGRSLADLWNEGLSASRSRRRVLTDAIISAHGKLLRAGWVFDDFVPKHLFLDPDDPRPEVTLIDLCRLSRAPGSEGAPELGLARLAAEAPRHRVSLAERLRFLARLHPEEDSAALRERFRRLDQQVWALCRRRKYRRHLCSGPIPLFSLTTFDPEGRLAFDPQRKTSMEDLGIDFARPDSFAPAGGMDAVLHRGPTSRIRLLFHVHFVLAGWVALPELWGRYLGQDEDSPAWLLVGATPGVSLADWLSRGESPSFELAEGLSKALSALVFMGILPEAPVLSWFRVEGGRRVHVTPNDSFVLAFPEERPTGGRDLLSGLDRELAEEGVEARHRKRLIERVVLERRQLLGGRRGLHGNV